MRGRGWGATHIVTMLPKVLPAFFGCSKYYQGIHVGAYSNSIVATDGRGRSQSKRIKRGLENTTAKMENPVLPCVCSSRCFTPAYKNHSSRMKTTPSVVLGMSILIKNYVFFITKTLPKVLIIHTGAFKRNRQMTGKPLNLIHGDVQHIFKK